MDIKANVRKDQDPLLPPKNSAVTNFQMRQAHQHCVHGLIAQTVSRFRQKYRVASDRKWQRKLSGTSAWTASDVRTATVALANRKEITRRINQLMLSKVLIAADATGKKKKEKPTVIISRSIQTLYVVRYSKFISCRYAVPT